VFVLTLAILYYGALAWPWMVEWMKLKRGSLLHQFKEWRFRRYLRKFERMSTMDLWMAVNEGYWRLYAVNGSNYMYEPFERLYNDLAKLASDNE
jgi:hypothetical protein